MLRLDDRHMRLAFLNYICAQLGEGNPGDLLSCGLDERQLAQLRVKSA